MEEKFTWVNPVLVQREYIEVPSSHEEALELFGDSPDFEELREAYWEGVGDEESRSSLAEAIKAGLVRVDDVAAQKRLES